MATMQALRQQSQYEPLQLETVPIPTAEPGSAVIKVLAASIVSYTREIYDGTRKYPYVTPLTAGTSAVGRIQAVGPDATHLKEGQLVLFDITIRSRDNPTDIFLSAIAQGSTSGSRKLMEYWRDGAYADFVKVPLENAFLLDEDRLCGELGYTIADFTRLTRFMVPWGGLVDIGLRPGETVVIAPATGGFGGGAVHVALALGARVIAMGRNTDKLAKLQKTMAAQYPADRLLTVPMIGNQQEETAALLKAAGSRGIECFFDISPPEGWNSTHFKAAIMALKQSGRVSLMGGQREDVPFPYVKVMHSNLQMKGCWMYTPDDVRSLIRFVEAGSLLLGEKASMSQPKEFSMQDWKKAFDYAFEDESGAGAIIVPNNK